MQVHLASKPKKKLTRIIDKHSCINWTGTITEDQTKPRESDQPLDIAIRETHTGETYDLLTFTPTELEIIYNIVKEKFQENIIEDMFSSYCFNM